jgi:hypothetical protein
MVFYYLITPSKPLMSSETRMTKLICKIYTFDLLTTAFPVIGVNCDPPENSEVAGGSHMTLVEVTFQDTQGQIYPLSNIS